MVLPPYCSTQPYSSQADEIESLKSTREQFSISSISHILLYDKVHLFMSLTVITDDDVTESHVQCALPIMRSNRFVLLISRGIFLLPLLYVPLRPPRSLWSHLLEGEIQEIR